MALCGLWAARDVPMSDIEKARQLFRNAGLAFPTIPKKFATRFKERGKWLFSTREVKISPYDLDRYVHESDGPKEYAILCHSGHGINSYAIQYYLVSGRLRMFLHLAWGGVHMDGDAAAAQIRKCFSLADQIVSAVDKVDKLTTREPLTIVSSDFYGGFWSAPGQTRHSAAKEFNDPAELLTEILQWLKRPERSDPLREQEGNTMAKTNRVAVIGPTGLLGGLRWNQ
jgi:hypothetical protein